VLWAAINHDPNVDYAPIVESLIEAGAKVERGSLDWWRGQKVLFPASKLHIEALLHGSEVLDGVPTTPRCTSQYLHIQLMRGHMFSTRILYLTPERTSLDAPVGVHAAAPELLAVVREVASERLAREYLDRISLLFNARSTTAQDSKLCLSSDGRCFTAAASESTTGTYKEQEIRSRYSRANRSEATSRTTASNSAPRRVPPPGHLEMSVRESDKNARANMWPRINCICKYCDVHLGVVGTPSRPSEPCSSASICSLMRETVPSARATSQESRVPPLHLPRSTIPQSAHSRRWGHD